MQIRQIRRIFLTGIAVMTPALVSFLIIVYIFNKIDDILSPMVTRALTRYVPELHVPGFVVSFLSIVVIAAVIFFVGLLTQNYIGNRLLQFVDRILSRTPLVRGIYTAVKQFLDAFRFPGREKFHKVVALEYPRKGMWAIGFLTSDVRPAIRKAIGDRSDRMVNVFIPTTPNPTSGYVVLVPCDQVWELDLTIEQAIKYVVSAGVIQNESADSNQPAGAHAKPLCDSKDDSDRRE